MNNNPEQFHIPEQPTGLPAIKANHSGNSEDPTIREIPKVEGLPPLTDDVIDTITHPNTPFEGFGGEQSTLSPEEKAQFDQWRASVADQYKDTAAKTPEVADKKKSKMKLVLGGIALGVVSTIASATIYVNAITSGITNSQDKDLPPAPETTNTAPVTPGQTDPTPSGEVVAPIDTKDLKFYSGEGDDFQTYEELAKSAELTVEGNPSKARVFETFVERMEDVANYFPSEKTVRASLNKPTEQLTQDDYLGVAEQYRVAHDVMFQSKSGPLYDTFKEIVQQSAFTHLQSLNVSDEVPYAVTFTLHTNGLGLLVADNSIHNSIDDNGVPQLGDYKLVSSGGDDIKSKNGSWQIAGAIGMVKKPTS